jgi:hypothetical protein
MDNINTAINLILDVQTENEAINLELLRIVQQLNVLGTIIAEEE